MTRNWMTWLALGALLGCGVTACGPGMSPDAGDATAGDGRADVVSADRADMAVQPDTMVRPDVMMPPDTFVPPDTKVEPDVVVVPDAGPDVVVTPDATPEAGPDVVVTPDAGPEAGIDAGVDAAPDVVVPVDSGADAVADGGSASVCDPARVVNLTTAGTLMGATTRYTGTTAMTPTGRPIPGPTECDLVSDVGRELALTYTVRTRGRLRISVDNPGTPMNFDTVVWVLDRCAASGAMELGCNDDNDTAGSTRGRASTLTSETIAAGATVTIIVAGYSPPTSASWVDNGAFELSVTEVPEVAVGGTCDPTGATNYCVLGASCVGTAPTAMCVMDPYPSTRIAPMCDDLSAATVVAGVTGDDAASAITALPFAFQFYSAAVTHYSVTTNGFAQLWPSMTGTPSTEYSNTNIPATAAPNNFVAPFWDDLNVGTGSVRSATLGTMPNRRFVIQWGGVRFNSGSTATALTFQIKLFETTNVIEFHYCTMTAGGTDAARVAGNSATVGLENAMGTQGREYAANRAMSVSPMDAIRFTP